jgi:hypothetical protein
MTSAVKYGVKYGTEQERMDHGPAAETLIARMRTVPGFIKLSPLAKRVADLMIRDSNAVNRDYCFGHIDVKWVSKQLSVSPSTVRRRIQEIFESGLMTTFDDPPLTEYTLGVLDDQP